MRTNHARNALFALAATTLALTGCTSPPMQEPVDVPAASETEEAQTPMQEPVETSTPTPTPDPEPAAGTRENPIPVDTLTQYASDSMWKFAVGASDPNGWENTIQPHDQYNPAPDDGHSYIVAPFHVEAVEESQPEGASPVDSLDITYVTAGGNSYPYLYGTACIVMMPNAFRDVGVMYPGAKADGNVCVSVPTEDAPGGTWRIAAVMDPDAFIFLDGVE
ncbi:hypothetical protein [Microbacterium karelineae]|uniref:hypothetical protein n=1 Tax=Microbacterium karelineae TaxID=2654283 RepID=UPI0012EAC9E8|nr:hypothetical protein [Microbacterium karelineae]